MTIKLDVGAYPIPPGEFLEEDLAARGLTMDEAAEGIGITVDELLCLLKGDALLTEALAGQLAAFLGSPVHIWLGLEEDYRAALAKRAAILAQREARAG